MQAHKAGTMFKWFLYFAAILGAWVVFDPDFKGPDEPIYYAYTASIVEDGDLNPVNRNLPVSDEFVITPTGNLPDFHNHGAVIFWAPAYIWGKFLSFCAGNLGIEILSKRVVSCALAMTNTGLGLFALWLCVLLCRRFGVSLGPSRASAAVVFFATPLFYYSLFETANANIPAFFFSVLLLLFFSFWEDFRLMHWFLFGMLLSVGACVKTELWMHLFYIAPFFALLFFRGRVRLIHFGALVAGVVPVTVLRAVNTWLKYGSLHMEEIIYWGSFRGFAVSYDFNGLLSSYRGIIYTSPILIVAAVGLMLMVWKLFLSGSGDGDGLKRTLFSLIGFYAVFKVWFVSGIFCPAGATLSGRVLMSELPVVIVFAAFFIDVLSVRLRGVGKFFAALLCGACIVWNMTVVGEYIYGLDWFFISGGAESVLFRTRILLDIVPFLFYPYALGLKVFVALPVLIFLAGALFLWNRRLTGRGSGTEFMNTKNTAGLISGFSVVCACLYCLVTAANASNNQENAKALEKDGFFDKATTVVVPALSLSMPESDQHLWTLFEMQRFFARRGDSAAVENIRTLRKQYFGSREYRQGTYFRPVRPGREVAHKCMRQKRFDAALGIYRSILEQFPGDIDVLLSMADIYEYMGDDKKTRQMLNLAYKSSAGQSFNTLQRLAEIYSLRSNTDKAIELYERVVELSPRAAESHFELSGLYIKKGFILKALDACRRAVELEPSAPGYVAELGQLHVKDGNLQKALECFSRALFLDPDNASYRAELAEVYELRGNIKLAQKNYAIASELAPFVDNYIFELGQMHIKNSNPQKALECFSRALALAPKNAAYHAKLAEVYELLGDIDLAQKSYAMASELEPFVADYVFELGQMHIKNGNLQKALECFLRALALVPRNAAYHAKLAEVYEMLGNIELAQKNYALASELEPSAADYVFELGQMYLKDGNMQKALECFSRALALVPKNAAYLAKLAEVYEMSGDVELAQKNYVLANELEPFNVSYLQEVALGYIKRGNLEKAAETYLKAIENYPRNGEFPVLLAGIEMELGNYEKARNLCLSACAIAGPWCAEGYAGAGKASDKLGDSDAAVDYYKQAIALMPDYGRPDYLIALGEIYEKTGHYEPALDVCKKVVAIEPFNTDGWLMLSKIQILFGQVDDSINSMRRAVDLNPFDGEALVEFGDILVRYSHFDEAEKIYMRAADIVWSGQAGAYFAAAQLSVKRGRFDDAQERFARALELKPNNTEYLRDIGFYFSDYGEELKAVPYFEKLVSIAPDSFRYWVFLGQNYAKVGQNNKAEQAFKKAREIAPDNTVVAHAYGEFLANVGDNSGALDVFLRASEKNPKDFALLIKCGEVCIDLEDFEQAAIVAQRMRELGRRRLADELEERIRNESESGGEEDNA